MQHLHRQLAPISEAGWDALENEAQETLRATLTGRRLFDVTDVSPQQAGVNLGQTSPLQHSGVVGVEASARRVQPLIQLRTPFSVPREDLEVADRSQGQPPLKSVTQAARKAALAEDRLLLDGSKEASLFGVLNLVASQPLPDDVLALPDALSEAVACLQTSGVEGPYALTLDPDLYTRVQASTDAGYPLSKHLERLLDGPIIFAPATQGALVSSLRGGDFEIHLGQDFSIGYADHDADSVQLYLEEAITFVARDESAAISLAA